MSYIYQEEQVFLSLRMSSHFQHYWAVLYSCISKSWENRDDNSAYATLIQNILMERHEDVL